MNAATSFLLSLMWTISLFVSLPGWATPSAEATPAANETLPATLFEGDPGTCRPTCRSGFYCQRGRCVSVCNPACPTGQHCVRGECELLPVAGEPTRHSYFALLGGPHLAVNGSAVTEGQLRVEIGGRYLGFEIGPGFGKNQATLRAAIVAFVPFQPVKQLPLFLMPTVHLGYAYTWRSDAVDTRRQELLLTPGLRLRYDLLPRLAVFFEPIQIEVNFVRFQSDKNRDMHRTSDVPVHWGMQGGIALLY